MWSIWNVTSVLRFCCYVAFTLKGNFKVKSEVIWGFLLLCLLWNNYFHLRKGRVHPLEHHKGWDKYYVITTKAPTQGSVKWSVQSVTSHKGINTSPTRRTSLICLIWGEWEIPQKMFQFVIHILFQWNAMSFI